MPVACPTRAPEAAPSGHSRVIGVDVARGLAPYPVTVAGSVLFAARWRRRHAQSPLERVLTELSGRARRAVRRPAAGTARTASRE